MELILASNSPRRRELLSKLNYAFSVIPSVGEETSTAKLPVDIAKELANRKALEVFKTHPDAVVIGCDTVVELDGQLLGKPKDVADAKQMLTALSGKTHLVHTGVCIVHKLGVWLFADTTEVVFDNLSDKQIDDYIATGSPMDKAGAYGIQDSGFVSHIVGSYDNVVGFPTERVAVILQTIFNK
ncbi:MAG: septum formation protein Maf [Clostridia bacterium]|nr:septum formation protein Maf [Clostridia bacterium]